MDETYHNLPVQIAALGAASKLRSTSSITTNNSHVEIFNEIDKENWINKAKQKYFTRTFTSFSLNYH